MKNKKDVIELILLGIIALVLVIGLILTSIHFKKNDNNKTDNTNSETLNETEDKKENSIQNNNGDKEENNSISNNFSDVNQNTTNNSDIKTEQKVENNTSNNDSISSNEIEVITYLESLNTAIETDKKDDITFKGKAKNAFVTVVDFLFYDSEIKGYTFDELTTSAKLKVISLALKIDNKIDEYFPSYKDSIKSGYENIKGKAALLYLETTSKLCDAVGSSACEEARNNFKNMKDSFGFTWSIIKTAAGNSYKSLKEILSEWYLSIK